MQTPNDAPSELNQDLDFDLAPENVRPPRDPVLDAEFLAQWLARSKKEPDSMDILIKLGLVKDKLGNLTPIACCLLTLALLAFAIFIATYPIPQDCYPTSPYGY